MVNSTIRGGAGKDTISLDLGAGSTQTIYGDKGNDLFEGSTQKQPSTVVQATTTPRLISPAPTSTVVLAMTL